MNLSDLDLHMYLTSLSELRKMYNNIIKIIHHPASTLNEAVEAKKLTDGGFYNFVGRMMKITENA